MFIGRELMVHAECGTAQARLAQIASASGLASASQAAYQDGLTHLARVGPLGDTPGVSKLVAVRVLDPVYREDLMTVALRWEATGAAGGLFPVLDANVTLAPAGEHSTRLALTGSYRPPLGRIGAALDKAILNRVAAATIHALLHSIADALTSPAAQGTPPPTPAPDGARSRRQKRPDERQRPDITCSHERGGAGGAATASRVQVRKDQDGRYHWHRQSASNRIIAWSGQACASKYWCVQDLNWLRANANLIMVYDYTGELAPPPPR